MQAHKHKETQTKLAHFLKKSQNRTPNTHKKNMATSYSAEQIFEIPSHQLKRVTIVADDEFLTHFTEKHARANNYRDNSRHNHHVFQNKNHLSIKTAVLSNDMFAEAETHTITIKGTDLKNDDLLNLIESTKTTDLIFIIQKIAPAQKKCKAFLSLCKSSTVITTKTLTEKKIRTWLQGCFKSKCIPCPNKLIEPLCQQLDWDLSSMNQLANQLAQHQVQTIETLDDLQPFILTTHQAPIYTLMNKIFTGDTAYCHAFFERHTQSDVLQKAYWLCMRRMRQYLTMQEEMISMQLRPQQLLSRENVWQQLQPQYLKALNIPQKQLQNIYLRLCELELALKGMTKKDFNIEAKQVLMHICARLK